MTAIGGTTTPASDHERLALLYQVSQSLGSSLELPTVLNQVMDAIIQLTGAERGFLMLMDRATGRLNVQAGRNLDRETIEGQEMEVSRTVIRRVIQSGNPVVTSNAQEDPRFASQASVIGFALRSIMCAPLRARGSIVGAVYVDSRMRSGIFSENDLGMLAAFANQAAMAIENARLFTMTDMALAARVEELSTLQRIDRDLNESLEFGRVMERTLEWAVGQAGADSGTVLLLDEQDGAAHVMARWGTQTVADRVEVSHPVVAQVLERSATVLLNRPEPGESVDGSPAVSQVVVPVKREGRIVALLSLESASEQLFGAEAVGFLERLADHAAIAIENARLYDAVKAANEAKSAFVSVVSHELRIPMTSIKGYADMLKSGAVGALNDMQGEFVEIIRRNVERMRILVSDLSDINRIESGRLRLEFAEVSLAEAVQEALSGLQNSFAAKQQAISVAVPAELPAVWADRSRVVQVVSNLLSNANKYSPPGRPVAVETQMMSDGERQLVQVAVRDQGIGISKEDQERLFSQFFRSEDPAVRSEVGWGLGLSIVKMLVEAQGGSVSVTSATGEGSTFAFTVPVAGQHG